MKNLFVGMALFASVHSTLALTVNIIPICSFNGTNGSIVAGSVVFQGADGNFYGTTTQGGSAGGGAGAGTVFKVTPGGTPSVLLYFSQPWAGSETFSTGLVQNGTTLYGTVYGAEGYNEFTITSDGTVNINAHFLDEDPAIDTNSEEVNIYFDTGNGIFGAFPSFLTTWLDTNRQYWIEGGNAYGGDQFAFELTNNYDFLKLVQDVNQNLEGISDENGNSDFVEFQHLQIFGTKLPGLKVTLDFPLGRVSNPSALLAGMDGNIYGVVQYGDGFEYGYVYKYLISLQDGLGFPFQYLHIFDGTDGYSPISLVQGFDGTLYGVTEGGYYSQPNFFTIDPEGTFVPYWFSPNQVNWDYFNPVSLFWGTDGNLYCLAAGGPSDNGVLLQINLPPSSPYPPVMSRQPASQVVLAGMSASFTAMALGTPPFGYQWQQNGVNVTNATNATYSIPTTSTTSTTSTGNYCCIITNAYGCVTSLVANLTVGVQPQNMSASIVNGQGIQLQMNGTTNFPYLLVSTTNLNPPVNWQLMVTNLSDSNGNWCYTDTNSSNYSARFYVITSP